MNKEELMARPMRKKFLFVIAMLSLSILMTGCKMGGGGDNTTTYVPAPQVRQQRRPRRPQARPQPIRLQVLPPLSPWAGFSRKKPLPMR